MCAYARGRRIVCKGGYVFNEKKHRILCHCLSCWCLCWCCIEKCILNTHTFMQPYFCSIYHTNTTNHLHQNIKFPCKKHKMHFYVVNLMLKYAILDMLMIIFNQRDSKNTTPLPHWELTKHISWNHENCNDFNVWWLCYSKRIYHYTISPNRKMKMNEHFHPLLMRYWNTRGAIIAQQLFLFAGKTEQVFPINNSSTKT